MYKISHDLFLDSRQIMAIYFSNTQKLILLIIYFGWVKSSPIQTDGSSTKCQNKCNPLATDGKINIHLVPHSHDDVGWLSTFSHYYYGNGMFNSMKDAGVQYIITSTINALDANPARRFIQVETAFFWKWWQHQNDDMKQKVVNLVNSGQLEIINGAWSMNDEAATHYQSTIDQFTWGFRILEQNLGECGRTKIGWQIDPFGHSREHASLLKQMGFEGLVLGRIDYNDKENRKTNQNIDFRWRTSNNLNNSDLFTTMFPNFYTYESGYCFDVLCSDRMSDNADYRKRQVDNFAKILDSYKSFYKTPNILIPMGGDFTYQKAETNFENADKLIEGFKDHPTYNVFYSTPSCYVKAVQESVKLEELTEKTDDFFPYGSDKNSYWTGYFTSRPALKRFERVGNNILQSAKQLTALSRIDGKEYDKSMLALRAAMGVVQHHDAITGTSKQAVADDYARLLHTTIKKAEKPLGSIIGHLLGKEGDVDLKLSLCLLSNVSICEESKKDKFLVAVYNPSSRAVSPYIRLPVDGDNFKITKSSSSQEAYDVFDTIHNFEYVKEKTTPAKKELVFRPLNIPPLGVVLYYVEKVDENQNAYHPFQDLTENDDKYFGSNKNCFTVDSTTGKLTSITMNGITLEVEQEFLYYNGVGSGGGRASGAYVFRPVNSTTKSVSTKIQAKYARGQLVEEVLQYLSPEVTQIIRAYKDEGEQYIEFDWLVGDLQLDENFGKEIITKFKIKNFSNKDVFYTDSNGRELIRRVRNKRNDYNYDSDVEPVSSNYYPITSKIVIKDEEKKQEFAILTDRAQGGSSLEDGTIEIMLHRRLVRDDGFGVDEVLDEKQYGKGLYVRGQHYLIFGHTELNAQSEKSTAALERDLEYRKLMEPLVLLGDATSENLNAFEKVEKLLNFKYSGLYLPPEKNLKILTFEPWHDSYLLRLEHMMEKDEDVKLSEPATINLKNLFMDFSITDIAETTLAVNILPDSKELVWKNANQEDDPFSVTLNPMEIKTFLIKTNKNNAGGNDLTDGDEDEDNDDGDDNNGKGSAQTLKHTSLLFIILTVVFKLF